MFPTRGVILVLILYNYLLSNTNSSKAGKKGGFEVIPEYVQECKNPNPAYAKKITIMPKYNIHIVNGTRYLSGNTSVLAPVQFLNFSGRTFAVDSTGKRVVKFQISRVSCRNFFVKAIIKFANMTFSKTCIAHKGFFRYDNLDLNKIMHAIPVWHSPGDIVHELQLVTDGATVFCTEIKVKIIE